MLEGFSLHANTHLHANDRQGLERPCRYGARGALALERLSRAEDGRIAYLPFTFQAGADNGVEMEKTARLVARVTELALTDGDAYDVWPPPPCLPAGYTCYHSAPAGTYDFSHCGTYRQVQRCTYASASEVFPQASSSP